MIKHIDLNADIGEADRPAWIAAEQAIMGQISSANIACGGHAGDHESMERTVAEAIANGVNMGAHPGYPDRENFGRKSLVLGADISKADLQNSIKKQICDLIEQAQIQGGKISYVKPHGALYTDAYAHTALAELTLTTVKDIDPTLFFMGAPGSASEALARAMSITFIPEAFIDRRYVSGGFLQSRKIEGAVIKDAHARMEQLDQLLTDGSVTTAQGDKMAVNARTLCMHSDSAGAVETACEARTHISQLGWSVRAFSA